MGFGSGEGTTMLVGYLMLAVAAHADAPPKAPPPEDSFLEFLGQDDVEDAKWWEFFKRPVQQDRDESDVAPPGEEEKR